MLFLQPQSASDIVARARAKGLISKNSKLRTSQSQSIKLESENDSSKGEESHSSVPPRRNHIKPSKKRNKSQTASLPLATSCPSSAKPSRQRVPPATHLSHASSSKESKDHLPEHLKVLKHPAPFRWIPSVCTGSLVHTVLCPNPRHCMDPKWYLCSSHFIGHFFPVLFHKEMYERHVKGAKWRTAYRKNVRKI